MWATSTMKDRPVGRTTKFFWISATIALLAIALPVGASYEALRRSGFAAEYSRSSASTTRCRTLDEAITSASVSVIVSGGDEGAGAAGGEDVVALAVDLHHADRSVGVGEAIGEQDRDPDAENDDRHDDHAVLPERTDQPQEGVEHVAEPLLVRSDARLALHPFRAHHCLIVRACSGRKVATALRALTAISAVVTR